MLADTLVGRVNRVEQKQTQSGAPCIDFSVATNKGFGDNKIVTWYDCRSYLPVILEKGDLVKVFGYLTEKTVGEKTYKNFQVEHVEAISKPKKVTPSDLGANVVFDNNFNPF